MGLLAGSAETLSFCTRSAEFRQSRKFPLTPLSRWCFFLRRKMKSKFNICQRVLGASGRQSMWHGVTSRFGIVGVDF
jgi:hypothetical protein